MPSPLLERMKTLCSLPGPPGHEGAVRDAIAEMLKDSASELRRDAIGNLIARHEANEAVASPPPGMPYGRGRPHRHASGGGRRDQV